MVITVDDARSQSGTRLDGAEDFFKPRSLEWFQQRNTTSVLFQRRHHALVNTDQKCLTDTAVVEEQELLPHPVADGSPSTLVQHQNAPRSADCAAALHRSLAETMRQNSDAGVLESALRMDGNIWWKMGVDFIPPFETPAAKVEAEGKKFSAPKAVAAHIAEQQKLPGGEDNQQSNLEAAKNVSSSSSAARTRNETKAKSASATKPLIHNSKSRLTTTKLRRTGFAALQHSFETVFSFRNLRHLLHIPWQAQEESFSKILYQASLPHTPQGAKSGISGKVVQPHQFPRPVEEIDRGSISTQGTNSGGVSGGSTKAATPTNSNKPRKSSRYSMALQHELEEFDREQRLHFQENNHQDPSFYRQGTVAAGAPGAAGDNMLLPHAPRSIGDGGPTKLKSSSSLRELVTFSQEHQRSVRVQRLERFGGRMRALHTDFSNLFPKRDVGINLYYSPAPPPYLEIESKADLSAMMTTAGNKAGPSRDPVGGGGKTTLDPHADDMDEFVVQVFGYKKWRFLDTNETLILGPGDGLFVPKNTWHHTQTLPGVPSAHIAIGVSSHGKGNAHGHDLPPPLYMGAPPEQKSFLEVLQEEHWTLITLFAAYAVQALLLIGLALVCIGYWVKIDPDQGGRGSTVRSRRLVRRRQEQLSKESATTSKQSAGTGEDSDADEILEDLDVVNAGEVDRDVENERASASMSSTTGFIPAGSEEADYSEFASTVNRVEQTRGEVEVLLPEVEESSALRMPTTAEEEIATLAALNNRVRILSERLAAEVGDDSLSQTSLRKTTLKQQYRELETALAEAEAQEQRLNGLRRRAGFA
ncbi:unnamed protein product [Amoebophrya sp. A120]|nr:unnamed protein product [Amoebophrya sp. A120]|eukprot:GSA120T00019086001.1